VLVAVVAWLLARRGPKPTPRPRFDSATLDAAAQAPWGASGLSGAREAAAADGTTEEGATPPPQPAEPVAEPGPAWHSRAAVPAGVAVPPQAADALHASVAATGEDVAGSRFAATETLQGGSERIELARAYLDLGDIDTARDLLREVAHAGDPVDRAEASRLLDGIA
jgi:pilus assembly protein FimV